MPFLSIFYDYFCDGHLFDSFHSSLFIGLTIGCKCQIASILAKNDMFTSLFGNLKRAGC